MKKLILFLFTIIFVSQSVQCMECSFLEDVQQERVWREQDPELYKETKKRTSSIIEIGGCACYACVMCCACCKMVVLPALVNTTEVIASKRME